MSSLLYELIYALLFIAAALASGAVAAVSFWL